MARPSDQLEAMIAFYRDGLGFEVLRSFEDPDGYHVVLQSAAWGG